MLPFQNGQLEVWTAKSRLAQQKGGADIYVLRFYGNADRADRWAAAEAEMWNDRAVEIWGMNYPGFGGSTGPARLSRIGPAALTAFDELKRQAADRPVVVFGTSIGATPALHVAAHRRAAGLILHNPAAAARNHSAPVWLVESLAAGGSGRAANSERPRQHFKREGDSRTRNLFVGRRGRSGSASLSEAGG